MALKTYSDDFRRQAVDLYLSTPGATLKDIAADLGISRGTLAHWVEKLGTPTAPTAGPALSSAAGRPRAGAAGPAAAGPQEPSAARVAELEARVAELEAEQAKLATERDILRQAAKYFAGETNW